jgi:hypothetical protein
MLLLKSEQVLSFNTTSILEKFFIFNFNTVLSQLNPSDMYITWHFEQENNSILENDQGETDSESQLEWRVTSWCRPVEFLEREH